MHNVWQDKRYYERIETLEKFDHPGFLKIKSLSKSAKTILDVGCGDGSKLHNLGGKYGVEISKEGVQRGKKLYPEIEFSLFNGKKLPYRNNFFDLTTSHFVLEHTTDPKSLLLEMLRVTKSGGLVSILVPNYGAPNRASPNFQGSRNQKLISGLKFDIFPDSSLSWHKVTPKNINMASFETDDDTTIEPYLNSLRVFLKSQGCAILAQDSFWQLEERHHKKIQDVFGFLGKRGLYPFKFWGPHLFIVARKK